MLKFSNNPDLAEQQMNAIIFYLTAFGYIDGEFDRSEKTFVREYIRNLVHRRAVDAMPDAKPSEQEEVAERFVIHFHEVFENIDRQIRLLFTEAIAEGEKVEEFIYAKLKLKSYEIFQSFDEENQRALLSTVEELIGADGKVHPAEAKFRDEVIALLDAEIPLAASDIELEPIAGKIEIQGAAKLGIAAENHPFFSAEEHYSADPVRIRKQAEHDFQLITQTMAKLDEQRARGRGRLLGKTDVSEFAGQAPFLDGHVYVHPVHEGESYDLTVLGDLHGCYSCLKAAIMQANFFAKVEAYRLDPKNNPNPKLIFLGDYIDRGRFSYNGVLRTVMQLFLAAPEHVYVLRGNHEYYIEFRGRVYGGVKPAEAINSLIGHMPSEMFEAYMRMFEELPNMLLFDRTLFVHAGIPRDSTIAEKWTDLSSLNDADIRFQMLWSDPSNADFIPADLQDGNARFPFGRRQFDRFMAMTGCNTMVRGHEKIEAGFATVYSGATTLLNLFSAGGADNNDLPPDSSYREVRPMALSIKVSDAGSTVVPWEIDYGRFNDPVNNRFFASNPEIEHKA